MREKQQELFDQYDMELLHVKKGRGGWICQTKEEQYALQSTSYSPKRLEQTFEIKERLMEQGFLFVDQYKRNKEGELLTYDRYQTSYVMKRHFSNPECALQNINDIAAAGRRLAVLHQCFLKFPNQGYYEKRQNWKQKSKELLRTRQYIVHRNEKKKFELLFYQYFDLFWKEMENGGEDISYEPALCHGSCHQHHFLMLPKEEVAILSFEKFYLGNQMDDVFQFLRKILEKNHYQQEYANSFLAAYQKEKALQTKDFQYLYLCLSYPEKYWKLANQYMNQKKSFLSPKLTEKLEEAVKLQPLKEKFLYDFRLNYL